MKKEQLTIHPALIDCFTELNRWLAALILIGLLLTSTVDALGVVIVNTHQWDTPRDIGSFLVRQAFRFVIFCLLYAAGILALRRSFMRISANLKSVLYRVSLKKNPSTLY